MDEVVIGVDDSPFSEAVVDQAFLAADRDHAIRVINAWTLSDWRAPAPRQGDTPSVQRSTSRARASHKIADDQLHAGLSRCDSSRCVMTNSEAHEGEPGPVLVRTSQDADLLVVGGRRHQHALGGLGPVTTFVLRHATCPVMVVPKGIAVSTERPRRLVVGVDDSTCSRSALRWALSEGRRRRCSVVAIYVCPTDVPPVTEPMAFDPKLPDYEALMLKWLANQVELAGGSADPAQVTLAVRHGSASAALLYETGPEDVLIVGSRGHGGFVGLMLGSVALQCVEHAICSVIVVPAAHERRELPEISCVGWMPSPWAVSL